MSFLHNIHCKHCEHLKIKNNLCVRFPYMQCNNKQQQSIHEHTKTEH